MSYNGSDLICMLSKSRFCQQMEELSSLVPGDVYNYLCFMRMNKKGTIIIYLPSVVSCI